VLRAAALEHNRLVQYRHLVAAVFVVALFADVLDATIVNVALPTLGRELHVGSAALEWIVTGYLLSLAVWIPASGWFGDRFGTRRVFLIALSVFLLGSALCGLAWNAGSLIAFRVLQGAGGGMLTPVGTAMVVRAFPPHERARGSAIIAIPAVLAPVLGPVLGGWLVDTVGWRWIFYVNIPIGVVGLGFAAVVLQEYREQEPGHFDHTGFTLAAVGLVSLLYGLSRVPLEGWTSPAVIAGLAVGIVAGAILVRIELQHPRTMLDFHLFEDRLFAVANLTNGLTMAALAGTLFIVPLYLQDLRGLSALDSGLTSVWQAIGLLCVMPLAGLLYRRAGARRLVIVGLSGTAMSAVLLTLVDPDTSFWWIRADLFGRGVSFGLALLPLQTATFANVGLEATGRASAVFNCARQVASSLGVAALASALTAATGAAGFQAAFAASAAIGVAATAAALRLPDER
jgi:EmrB/QacA subfamily drug resistance transporter